MTQSYYHLSSANLAVGSTINPGALGRLLQKYPFQPQNGVIAWRLSAELIFEMIRREHYPGRPSRLDSCFLFTSREDAIANWRVMGIVHRMYRVEMVDENAPRHIADFALWRDPEPNADFIPAKIASAHAYWTGQNIATQELLTASPITIVEIIEHGDLPSLSDSRAR